jgi:chaperonin cofactor prefoldin
MAVRIDFESVEAAAKTIEQATERLQAQTVKLKAEYEIFAGLSSPAVPFAKKLVAYAEKLDEVFKSLQESNEEFDAEVKKYQDEADEINESFSL